MTEVAGLDAATGTVRPPRGKEAERILAAEQLQELRQLRQTMTEMAARTSGRMVNNTLLVGTYQFGTDGQIPLDLRAAAGAIRITNLSGANTMTVTGTGAQGYAPNVGIGVAVIPAGARETVAVDSHQITLYGTSGDRVTVQVFAKGIEPTT